MEAEEDLEEILARIAEQEASEALARQLEVEWNAPSTSSTSAQSHPVGQSSKPEVIVIDEDETEDDEAMARRLAQEWGSQDTPLDQTFPSTSTSTSHSHHAAVDASSSPDHNAPPDACLLKHKSMFTSVDCCPKCEQKLEAPRGQVIFSASVPPPSLLMLLHVSCISCQISYCRGCLAPTDCAPNCKGKHACLVKTCCAAARAIAIFEALGGLDRAYLNERAATNHRANEATKLKRAASESVGPGGTGYGTGRNHGSHDARPSGSKKRKLNDGKADVVVQVSSWDNMLVAAITTVTEFLPAPYTEHAQAYDLLPNPCIGHLISLSYLPDLLAGLLRNDSVTDWVDRKDVYYAVIALLRRMVDCELTVECLIRPRWEKLSSCGLEEWMWGDGKVIWEIEKNKAGRDTATVARSAPLYDSFTRLNKQCQTFIAGAQHVGDDADDDLVEEMVQATSLCGDITAARDDIERAVAALGLASPDICPILPMDKGKGTSELDLEKAYAAFCERLAFQHTETDAGFGPGYASYNYFSMLSQTEKMTRQPKDRLHFVKELAVMATCLPPGVWVRVDEVRNDAIKILIAGPEGTPYAGGLFEFDCFIPIEYPHKPPCMHLRTTGGGSVRFNPNLYNCGKVCLSLLGTWPGRPEEQWTSKSTLLQVIISIQSMIFVEAPYFNEPGHGKANANAHQSIAYNHNIALQTTRWAIVHWMKEDLRGSVWKDVIKSHFTIRKTKIRKCIREWAAANSAMYRQSQLVDEFEAGLMRIQGWS